VNFKKENEMSAISEKVAEQLSSSGDVITGRVIAHLVEREVSKRSEAVIRALDVLDKLIKESKKIKPDLVAFGDDGKVISQSWSKQKIDERDANNAKIAKTQSVIDKALERNDYSDLFNLVNNNAKPEQPGKNPD